MQRRSAAHVFAALGDETRLHLVARLSGEGPLSITSLAEGFDVTRQAITKHLVVMEEAGLVSSKREGRERVWSLHEKRLEDARRHLELISMQWDEVLDRLKQHVEK